MDEEKWLRDRLGQRIPTPPAAADRAIRSRQRFHRRRKWRGAAVVLTTVGLVAAVTLSVSLTGNPQDDTATPRNAGRFECPSRREPVPRDFAALPSGAIAVRQCIGNTIIRPPAGALTTDVDSLVNLVNDLPTLSPQGPCLSGRDPSYRLAFQYPDGVMRTISGVLSSCSGLTVGTTLRADGERAVARFVELLREQRRASTPPTDLLDPPLRCEDAGFVDPLPEAADPEDLARAVVCVYTQNVGGRMTELTSDELSALTSDLATAELSERSAEQCKAAPGQSVIAGSTIWGDVISLDWQCGHVVLSNGKQWQPGPAAIAVLRGATARAAASELHVVPDENGDLVLAAYVDLINTGHRAEALDLWVDPSQAVRPGLALSFRLRSVRDVTGAAKDPRYKMQITVVGDYAEGPPSSDGVRPTKTEFQLVRDRYDQIWRILSRASRV